MLWGGPHALLSTVLWRVLLQWTLYAHDDGVGVAHVLPAYSDDLFSRGGGHTCGHRLQGGGGG